MFFRAASEQATLSPQKKRHLTQKLRYLAQALNKHSPVEGFFNFFLESGPDLSQTAHKKFSPNRGDLVGLEKRILSAPALTKIRMGLSKKDLIGFCPLRDYGRNKKKGEIVLFFMNLILGDNKGRSELAVRKIGKGKRDENDIARREIQTIFSPSASV